MKEIKILPPFKNFILENFPFIEEDFDALTNYELLCHVVNYIKTMGDEFNTIANDVNGLLNWFNNLDVQDEINNKLDEMVEDGTLQEIIADYLNSKAIFGFDSVADMKSTTNLIDGSFAKTMGYYAKNDGGSSLYKIREITNDDVVDEMFIIALSDNTLIAELIYGDSVNIDQLGCKGDNSTNNSTLLNAILNNNKISHITLSKDKTYLCNSTITISKSIFLDGNMGTLKSLSSDNGFVVEILPASGETVHDVEPFIIKNVIFKGENCDILFNNKQGYKGLISQCYFYNFTGIGLKHTKGYETIFEDLRFIGQGQDSIGIYCNNNDVHFNHIFMRDCKIGFRLYCSAVYFNECHGWLLDTTLYEGSKFIEVYGQGTNYMDNIQADTYQYGIYFGAYGHIISNNYKCLFATTPSQSIDDDSYVLYYSTSDIANYDWITNLKDVIVEGTNAKTKFSNITASNSHISCNIVQSSDTTMYEYNNNYYTLTPGTDCSILRQEVTRDDNNMVHLSVTVKVTNATIGYKAVVGFPYSVIPKTNLTAIGFASSSDYLTTAPEPVACYCTNNIQVYFLTAGTQTVYFEATYLAKNDRRNQ